MKQWAWGIGVEMRAAALSIVIEEMPKREGKTGYRK